jgi:SAM-dependent methyltransferase
VKRWQAYGKDPNDPALHALRQQAIARARAGVLIADRVEYLCAIAAGKSVLDIGVVEHAAAAAANPRWLHGEIRRHAAQCFGVDVLPAEIAALQAKGYNVACVDVTEQPLAQRFDVIIAGEVIEHLDATGRFMHSCAAMLAPGGRLALSAPNPWYANAIVRSVLRGPPFVDSADHVGWYDAAVLYELGQRHGLRLERFAGVGGSHPRTWKGRLVLGLRPLLLKLGLRAELFAKSIIYEFVRASH